MSMDVFMEGDRVAIEKWSVEWATKEIGAVTGTVKDYFCDYGEHRVGVRFDNGVYRELNPDTLVNNTDHYEYNLIRTSREDGFEGGPWLSSWVDLETAEDQLLGHMYSEEENEKEHGFRYADYRIVKRRKAGPIEDV